MNVLLVVAEMAPLAKVGGVGDVGGSLPRALRQHGLDVRVALPFYGSIEREGLDLERVATAGDASFWRTAVRDVPVYLVEHDAYFNRERVYNYKDDLERFLAFADGLLAGAAAIDWRPDVVHVNDWHTGFVATRLFDGEHPWSAAARVGTIHNLAYEAPFTKAWARKHGIGDAALRSPDGLRASLPYGGLAQALLHADAISTVSPTYAREILTPDAGGEMAPFLRTFGDRLWGILNGIDMEAADPATDRQLAATFDAGRLDARAANKRSVQRELGLPEDGVPLVGMIARLVVQKGADLAAAAIERLLAEGQRFQIAVLGEGEEQYERELSALAARHPANVGVRIAFDLRLSQLIYGGSDIFLMPSRYEPCGLGQMFAMRYGSVPVVHRTGGLADSVRPYDAATDSGTGFLFGEPSADALAATLREALAAHRDGEAWRRLQRRGMAEDFSWSRSAGEYVRLYERAIELAKSARGR